MSARIHTTLEVLIVQLNNHLTKAKNAAEMAETSIAAGHRNQAIGCLDEAKREIDEIASLRDAIYAIHR